ncbi:MAG: hypothetical protein QME61_00380 [Patescibacteria group bacterium]|nr:hypothetical protein [Patescibacteria group bacterium]
MISQREGEKEEWETGEIKEDLKDLSEEFLEELATAFFVGQEKNFKIEYREY